MVRLFQRLAVLVVVLSVPRAEAQTSRALAEKHPAGQVVVQFLRYSTDRQFDKAASLITPESLATLQQDYLKRVMKPSLPLDEMTAMCRAVGVADESGIAAMSPTEFYTAYNKGLQKRYNVTDEINKRIADTLELSLLSIAEEGPSLVHLLVRTKHQTMVNFVENLEIVSLVKKGNQWLVALGEQQPKYTPLNQLPHPAPATPPAPAPAAAPPAPGRPK